MEVRCCCNPGILIGYLPDPSEEVKFRAQRHPWSEKVVLRTKDGGTCEVEVSSITSLVGSFPAYKSNDLPIEFFRNIVDFVENKRD